MLYCYVLLLAYDSVAARIAALGFEVCVLPPAWCGTPCCAALANELIRAMRLDAELFAGTRFTTTDEFFGTISSSSPYTINSIIM